MPTDLQPVTKPSLADRGRSGEARRDALFRLLQETAERTRDLIMRWAPIMVSRSPLAESLSRFADTHSQIVKALGWLHPRAGWKATAC